MLKQQLHHLSRCQLSRMRACPSSVSVVITISQYFTSRELQRFASELELQAGLQTSSGEAAEAYATPETWQKCADGLNSTLAAFGYPCGLQLQSQEPEQLANTCNVLHTLLVQRQRDVSQRAQFDDHFQRMRSDLNVSEQTRDRLRSQLDAKQREHGTLLSQWRVQERHLQGQLSQLSKDRDDAQKQCADLQRRHAQSQHEIRRKDAQGEKLKEQLRNTLMERKREAKKAFDMAGAFSKDAAARPSGARLGKKSDDSTLKLVVSSYEARQEELLQENKGLSAALADLQSDYKTLANKHTAAQQLHAAAVRQVVEDEDLQHVLRSSDAGQVQAELSAKMAAMKTKIEGVYDGPMQQELTTTNERRLFQELQNTKNLVQEQALLVQSAMMAMTQQTSLASNSEAQRPGRVTGEQADGSDVRAEYETRLAVVAKQAEQDKAAMTQRWHAWEQEQKAIMQRQLQDQQLQVDAVQRKLSAQQQHLHAQAKEERNRLQQQEQALAQARLQFEREQEAAKGALRSFAPGFGAGKLLADAMARRISKAGVCNSHGSDPDISDQALRTLAV
ncbi:hypothetical protein WJX79_004272 [Trebouxia sp. C0005]